MINKRTVKICLGSSCFARGNNRLIPIVKKFIERHCLEDKVLFIGDHCFSECHEGPNIRISGKTFQGINENNIEEILKSELSDLI